MPSGPDRNLVWRKMETCLIWCFEHSFGRRDRQAMSVVRRFFQFLKYKTYGFGQPERAAMLLGISTLVIIASIALGFPEGLAEYPVDSARYFLSALAQTIAALLAVSFTAAFVIFQVASARLTARSANVILRNVTLNAFLTIGAATILASLVVLTLLPEKAEDEVLLLSGSVSSWALACLFLGAVVLFIVVVFFVFVLDYVRPQTILEIHSRALHSHQSRLLRGSDAARAKFDITEELRVLTELSETLIKREDRKVFGLLSEILCGAYGQALRIWDKCVYDKGERASAVHDVMDAYALEVFAPLIDHIDALYDARTSRKAKEAIAKESERFMRDWLLVLIEPLADELQGCGECENSEPLERILAILEKLSGRIPSEFIRPYLKSWGNAISLRIQQLDQLADEAELGHISALIDGLMIVIKRTTSPGVLDTRGLLHSIMLKVVDDDGNSAPLLKHWSCTSGVVNEHKQYTISVRKIFWRALFEVFGSRHPYLYISHCGKIFNLEVCATPLSESFLEEILQHVWLKENEASEYITFWLSLRIYLAHNLKIWPVTNCASSSLLNDRLIAQIDAALEDMPKHGDLLDWTFLTGVDTGSPGYNDLSINRVNEALDGLKKALHRTD